MAETSDSGKIDRRGILRGAVASPVVLAASSMPSQSASVEKTSSRGKNRIAEENAKTGDADWQLTRVRINQGKYRTTLVEGFCSHQSIASGETLRLYLSADPARLCNVDIYRMGYYNGAGARRVHSFASLPVTTQPTPEMTAAPERLRECQWKPTAELVISDDWTSGVYLGKLTTIPESKSEPYWQSYIVFIVRDERPADVLFQCSDNTWQAYNRWPANESLYTHPDGAHAPDVA